MQFLDMTMMTNEMAVRCFVDLSQWPHTPDIYSRHKRVKYWFHHDSIGEHRIAAIFQHLTFLKIHRYILLLKKSDIIIQFSPFFSVVFTTVDMINAKKINLSQMLQNPNENLVNTNFIIEWWRWVSVAAKICDELLLVLLLFIIVFVSIW